MKKIVKLTESDLVKLIKKVVNETNVDKDKVKNTTYKPKMESVEMDEAESEVDRKKKGCCRPSYPCVSDYYMCVNCQCVKRIKV